MNEFEIITKIFKKLANSKTAQNLANDTAFINLNKIKNLVISKDVFIEDVHFLKEDGGFKIASKLLRTNLSDLAASGATPLYYMLGFSKNNNLDSKFISDFARGLKELQKKYNISLIGGDTVNSDKLIFSITILGQVPGNYSLDRNQAKAGDLIFTSGTIGDAFLGRNILKNNPKANNYLTKRHFFPSPRLDLGQNLISKKLTKCAIDISDGLIGDLNHLCQESKLDATIFLDKIPLSNSAKKILKENSQLKIENLISGGDDYELLFSINPQNEKKLLKLAKTLKISLTKIGNFKQARTKKPKITILDSNNCQIKINKMGYEH